MGLRQVPISHMQTNMVRRTSFPMFLDFSKLLFSHTTNDKIKIQCFLADCQILNYIDGIVTMMTTMIQA